MTTNRTRKAVSGDNDGAAKAPTKKTSKKSSNKAAGGSPAPRKRASAPKAVAKPKASAARVARESARQLLELTGRPAEGVTALERTDEGWKVQVEVVEVRRIPDTTDLLALYELDVDEMGALEGYRRVRRFTRGAADGD